MIGKFTDETTETVGEVAKDVKDAVGQALEQGVQSITGSQLTPQQIQQKQQAEQKRLSDTRKWLQDVEIAQQKVRAENKQKEEQRLQAQKQEEQVAEIEEKQEKEKPVNPAIAYAGKVEIKRGVGG